MLNLSFKGKNFHIFEKFLISAIIAGVVFLTGLGFMIFKGMNIGIEFSGGAILTVEVDDTAEGFNKSSFEDTYKSWLRDKGYTVNDTVQTIGDNGYEFRISDKSKDLTNSEIEDLCDEFKAKLSEDLNDETVEVRKQFVDNRVMLANVRTYSIAVAVAIVVILIYIAIRFTWISGLAAVIALIHDSLIMIALTTIFYIPVNATFIAAVVTILGYSINATIVIFDRVRELLSTPSLKDATDGEIVNEAIMDTLSRSILTTLTTLVMIVLLAIFGNSSIREFALPIIFGLIAGGFSSVFLSAPLWVYLRKLFKQANVKSNKKKSKKANA